MTETDDSAFLLTIEALRGAYDAGWQPCGTKLDGTGRLCFGLFLEATGERIWFDEPTLQATFVK
ncbi:hypothetical protein [Synechococcus phage S-N03]|uniref:Uncharacterized protein n=1 Tax=Synechococcus phage S-N03 TaxID=2718943 RepID=A0A6G8R5K7_9CAUD|nr:hypothetical protein PQC09_gp062 [Synechococcus phage S-N03]QIN96697.1 hypothetical protein [Synechococcus phage S-N03]